MEILDTYFGNVCELDLVFNFYKVYAIVDEIFVTDDPEYKPTLQKTVYWNTFMMENN